MSVDTEAVLMICEGGQITKIQNGKSQVQCHALLFFSIFAGEFNQSDHFE